MLFQDTAAHTRPVPGAADECDIAFRVKFGVARPKFRDRDVKSIFDVEAFVLRRGPDVQNYQRFSLPGPGMEFGNRELRDMSCGQARGNPGKHPAFQVAENIIKPDPV